MSKEVILSRSLEPTKVYAGKEALVFTLCSKICEKYSNIAYVPGILEDLVDDLLKKVSLEDKTEEKIHEIFSENLIEKCLRDTIFYYYQYIYYICFIRNELELPFFSGLENYTFPSTREDLQKLLGGFEIFKVTKYDQDLIQSRMNMPLVDSDINVSLPLEVLLKTPNILIETLEKAMDNEGCNANESVEALHLEFKFKIKDTAFVATNIMNIEYEKLQEYIKSFIKRGVTVDPMDFVTGLDI
ncbi:hypothetical protein COB57_01860 [Candidatus Peregrinibacteria bacterium]|nr:MAG: hypothetical protein COB57_01860 [Candidatus Peregrinibacteria bacterium]